MNVNTVVVCTYRITYQNASFAFSPSFIASANRTLPATGIIWMHSKPMFSRSKTDEIIEFSRKILLRTSRLTGMFFTNVKLSLATSTFVWYESRNPPNCITLIYLLSSRKPIHLESKRIIFWESHLRIKIGYRNIWIYIYIYIYTL